MDYTVFSNIVTMIIAIGGGFIGIYLLGMRLGLFSKINGNGKSNGKKDRTIDLVQTNEKIVSAIERQNERLDDIIERTNDLPVIKEKVDAIQRKVETLG